jgi:hypothetical protein
MVSSAEWRARRPESARCRKRRAARWPSDSEFLDHEVKPYEQACKTNSPSTLAWVELQEWTRQDGRLAAKRLTSAAARIASMSGRYASSLGVSSRLSRLDLRFRAMWGPRPHGSGARPLPSALLSVPDS